MRNLLKACAGLAMAAALMPATAGAKDYLVTISKPGHLYVIDAAARSVVKDCRLGFNVNPAVFVMSPDNRIAYILGGRWSELYGVDIETCDITFSARQSSEKVRVRTIASIAVSKDGKELYTVQNPVRLLPDRYEVMAPRLAVYDTTAGRDASPARTYPAPRRITVMATGRNGALYAAGHDVFEIDPKTGATSVKIANANWDRPRYSPPDVLAFWPVGSQNDEFLLLYTAAVFQSEKMEELADFVWGYQTIDLTSGDSKLADFASIEVLMFTAVRNPQKPNELFGVYTQLSKHDIDKRELIKRVDLPHTYYVVNISSDGREVYVGGTNDDIGVYDSQTLERIGEVRLPSGGDMAAATLHVIQRGG